MYEATSRGRRYSIDADEDYVKTRKRTRKTLFDVPLKDMLEFQKEMYPQIPEKSLLRALQNLRKVKVMNVPANATEVDLFNFFTANLRTIIGNQDINPVESVRFNDDKSICFLLLDTEENAKKCLSLLSIVHYTVDDVNYELHVIPYSPEDDPEAKEVIGIPQKDENQLNKLFVGGVPPEWTEDQLKDILLQFGPLISYNLVKDPMTGNSKGYAFTEFVTNQSTEDAILKLNGKQFGNRTMLVQRAVVGAKIPAHIRHKQLQEAKLQQKMKLQYHQHGIDPNMILQQQQEQQISDTNMNVPGFNDHLILQPPPKIYFDNSMVLQQQQHPEEYLISGTKSFSQSQQEVYDANIDYTEQPELSAMPGRRPSLSSVPHRGIASLTTTSQLEPDYLMMMKSIQDPVAVFFDPSMKPDVTLANLVANSEGLLSLHPTNTLILYNLFRREDFELMEEDEFQELQEDIRKEAEKFGNILSFDIPHQIQNNGHYNTAGVLMSHPHQRIRIQLSRPGKVVIVYENMEQAHRAQQDFAGRRFQGRNTITSFGIPNNSTDNSTVAY